MPSMDTTYDPDKVEREAREYWEAQKCFEVGEDADFHVVLSARARRP